MPDIRSWLFGQAVPSPASASSGGGPIGGPAGHGQQPTDILAYLAGKGAPQVRADWMERLKLLAPWLLHPSAVDDSQMGGSR